MSPAGLGLLGIGISAVSQVPTGIGTHLGAKALAREKAAQIEQMENQRRRRIGRMDQQVGESAALNGTQAQRSSAAYGLQTAASNPTVAAGSTALGLEPGAAQRVKATIRPTQQVKANAAADQQLRMEQQARQAQMQTDMDQMNAEAEREEMLWAGREAVAAHKGEGWRLAGSFMNMGGQALTALGSMGVGSAGPAKAPGPGGTTSGNMAGPIGKTK